MDRFFSHCSISPGCAPSLIALVPKTSDPQSFADYRPISLIGIIYKVVAKILANRLALVVGSVVSDQQSAFIHGRSILDGPLIVSETISWLKASSRKAFLLKLDIDKAFDSVSWHFIIATLRHMNFPPRWIRWIKACLSSARASVLVNGAPTDEFNCTRGLRQGDPLSPLLFTIAMEPLTCLIENALAGGLFRGLKLPNGGPTLSHMLYADDVLVMGEWDNDNITNMVRILRCFYLISGLRVNPSKSLLFGVGVNNALVTCMASALNMTPSTPPFLYLGLPIGANMNQCRLWQPVIEAFQKRLSGWKRRTLSFGGRLTLTKSVLSSLPLYYFSLFRAPKKVLHQLERLRRSFFWAGSDDKKHVCWVAWKRTMAPKELGGLGIGSLEGANQALIARWWWRYRTEEGSLWRSVIFALHGRGCTDLSPPILPCIGGCWKGIVTTGKLLSKAGVDLLQRIQWSITRNMWVWEDGDEYVVHNVRRHLDSKDVAPIDGGFVWNSWVPKKVNIMNWRASMDRLPTMSALCHRGIAVSNPICGLCLQNEETALHLFTSCTVTNEVWNMVGSWVRINPVFAFQISDWLRIHHQLTGYGWWKRIVNAIVLITMWCIWKGRNELVHTGKRMEPGLLFQEIKVLSLLWISNRSQKVKKDWSAWAMLNR